VDPDLPLKFLASISGSELTKHKEAKIELLLDFSLADLECVLAWCEVHWLFRLFPETEKIGFFFP